MSQGHDEDDSDREWDDRIRYYYGAQVEERRQQNRLRRLDDGINLTGMVVEAYNLADRIRDDAHAERQSRESSGASGSREQTAAAAHGTDGIPGTEEFADPVQSPPVVANSASSGSHGAPVEEPLLEPEIPDSSTDGDDMD